MWKKTRVVGTCLLAAIVVMISDGPVAYAAEGNGPVAGQSETAFYVSPAGNDSSPGTLDKPFATISRARDAIRQLKKNGLAGDVTVYLRGGIYTVDKTIQFSPADSGTEGHRITYAAYGDEKPIIGGAVRLAGQWHRQAADHAIWDIQLPKGIWFQELFVDGKRQPRARIPTSGFLKARDLKQSRTEFGFDATRLGPGPIDAASASAIIRTYEWHEQHLRAAKIDVAAGVITLATPASYPVVPKGYGVAGEFALENLRAGMTEPGNWCLEKSTGSMSYRPTQGVDPTKADIRGATTRVLFDLCGDSARKQRVENICFRRLTFTQTGRIEKLEWGQYEGQAVRMQSGVANCSIRNCTFADLGGCGVTLWRDCRGIEIDGNEFDRVGDTAIVISDYLGEGPAKSGGNRIVNNRIHHGGVVRRNACGIEMSMTEGNLVAHNLLHDLPYIGIRLSGAMPTDWQAKNEPSIAPPFTADKVKPFIRSRNNCVEFNHIHHVMQTMADGGAIYFWGTMGVGANHVAGNLVEDVGLPGKLAVGIYMDDYCDDVQIRDNVVLRANWGLHLHGAPRITVENNIFAFASGVDCSIQPEKYNIPPMNSVIRRNIFYMGTGKIAHEWTNWSYKPIGEMNFNCWWREKGGKPIQLGFGQGFDKDSVVADPLFVDSAKPQAGLKSDSPALKLGFKSIDTSKVGPSKSP